MADGFHERGHGNGVWSDGESRSGGQAARSSRPATLLSPIADRWVTSGWEIGCAQAEQSRDDEVWADWQSTAGLSDLDELLSVLPGPATDEG